MNIKSISAIFAAALLCACSQNDSENGLTVPRPSAQVAFSIEGLSRADVRNLDDVYLDGFSFTCTQDGYEVASNTKAAWTGTAFVTNPPLFWPAELEEHPYRFHAVSAPSSDNISIVRKDGASTFQYTVAQSAADQHDVVVSSTLARAIPDKGVLKMLFTHAFTKVNFTIKAKDEDVNDGYVWKLSSVSLASKSQGTYTFDAETPWAAEGEPVAMQYLKEGQTPEVTRAEEWKGENNFMLIPQHDGDLTLTLTWAVYRKLGASYIKLSQQDATKTYAINTDTWQPNASIRYASIFLPAIGEDTSDENGNLDDNNMLIIGYDPSCN